MYWNRFDICEAYYTFFADYHDGMWGEMYGRMSKMLAYFKPSPMLCYETLEENGQVIYDNLVNRYGFENTTQEA